MSVESWGVDALVESNIEVRVFGLLQDFCPRKLLFIAFLLVFTTLEMDVAGFVGSLEAEGFVFFVVSHMGPSNFACLVSPRVLFILTLLYNGWGKFLDYVTDIE